MIYVVSGYMRSGTSMMMQCLQAGGMDVVKSLGRDKVNDAHSDEHYRPNPYGLFEVAYREMEVPGWFKSHDGKAVKVVAPWASVLEVHDYRVVFMRRDLEEVRQSQIAAWGGEHVYGAWQFTANKIEAVVTGALANLKTRHDVRDVIELEYKKVVYDPLTELSVLASAGWPIDPLAAASIVDPAQYRFRLERLTAGL
jgi:hypothetical protein